MPVEPIRFPDIQTHPAVLTKSIDKAHYEDTLHCNRCGFCTSSCPTYIATGDEGLSPRGRNQAFRAVLEGRLKDPAEAERFFSTCLMCGICTSVCFSEVPTAELMSAARGTVMGKQGEPWFLKISLRFFLPRPGLLEPMLKILFIGKRIGLSGVLNRIGFLRLISSQLSAADEMVDSVPVRFLRDRVRPYPPAARDADVIHFLACGPNYLKPEVGEATARILKRAGVRFGYVKNVCCGLPGTTYGDLPAARALAQKNIELLEDHPNAVILLDDSSCAASVKDYPALFRDQELPSGDDWRRRAEAVSRRTRDLSEWLVEKGIQFPHLTETTSVTYHDPCKARYAQKIVHPPRALLSSLPAVSFRELPEAEQCCGAGGTYCFAQPEISRAVLDRKAGNVISTKTDGVLTSSVSCLLQLQFGLRRLGSAMRALHLSEFLSPPDKNR
ncbi:MAG: (Fe-S)-binding protein [Elusimicrobia bacterium]|nr:(Fe-S)-binding protein [Elusimicrobiota bacterium]